MANRYSLEQLTPHDSGVLTYLDPHLQRLAIQAREQLQDISFTIPVGAVIDEAPVIAKVTDFRAWEALPDVRSGVVVHKDGGTEHDIVTGRIPVTRIEAVRQEPFVVSLKASHRLRPHLHATVTDLGADALPAASKTAGGQDVIVGLVDFGFDYVHSNFRNPDGTTRVLAIWDQTVAAAPGEPVKYGKLHTSDAINTALRQQDPYTALGYTVPASDADGPGTHATHVMDIAAGNGLGSGQAGVAPQADLIFVELSANTVPAPGPAAVSHDVGDSVHLLEAVQFIFNMAGNKPCVVNLSLGANLGPHDGTSLVELGLDRIVGEQPNRCIVVAAGNSFSDGIHAAGQVAQGGSVDLQFLIPEDDPLDHELEIWYPGPDRFDVEVIANGRSLLTVATGQTKSMAHSGKTAILVVSRLNDPNNHDNQIAIFLDKGLEPATWTIRLRGVTVGSGKFHAWLERDDNGAQFVDAQQDNSHTIGSLSSGQNTIVVGAYDAHTPSSPMYFGSSAGPTRDGRQKPEVSAPGVNVVAACSLTHTGVVSRLGTSMAAPAVAGIVALVLADAKAAGKVLSGASIRDLITATARSNPPAAGGWDPRYGHGRVSASGADVRLLAGLPAMTVEAGA
jgi:subtilisin family serine protease